MRRRRRKEKEKKRRKKRSSKFPSWTSSGVIPTRYGGLELGKRERKVRFSGEGAGASRLPARPKGDSKVQPLGRRASQSAIRCLLSFKVWRSAPCRAPRTLSSPILFTLSHACEFGSKSSEVRVKSSKLRSKSKTQVPRISIQHVVDPVEHSRVSGEPPCFPEDSVVLFS
uniref:Uncharacterized protein n=1 Tax=Solanum demissum TaxID=50514 RepID=Q6L3M8_SOLDE|nr:hypothetical protein SDM1_27t00006 [Solanum demissum]